MSLTAPEKVVLQRTLTRDLRTGILYRNRSPHLRSVHAYFPSVAAAGGRLYAAFTTGEAFEAMNLRLQLAFSDDRGATWTALPSPAPIGEGQLISESGRLAVMPNGELVLLLVRHNRARHREMGLVNPQNLGFVPMRFLITRSRDGGSSWTEPQPVAPPLVGPEFEMCAPITPLRDGRWLLPTSTWANWRGELPNGHRMIAFVSHDQGQSWPECLDIMHHPRNRIWYWESKIVQWPSGDLMTVAWAYDESTNSDLPNQYTISRDGGRSWLPPQSTGLRGQTITPFLLEDGRVLCVFRRVDRPGLWLSFSRLEGDRWINEGLEPLWGHEEDHVRLELPMVRRFQTLRFGAPCITRLQDGTIFVAFWCYEDCVGIIRWFSFRVD